MIPHPHPNPNPPNPHPAQGWYKNANDLFRKISQARWGGYVGVNTELASGGAKGATLPPEHWNHVVACTLAVWRGRSPHVAVARGGAAETCRHTFTRATANGQEKTYGLLGAAPRGHDIDCAAGGGAQRATCFRALGLADPERATRARPPNMGPGAGGGARPRKRGNGRAGRRQSR